MIEIIGTIVGVGIIVSLARALLYTVRPTERAVLERLGKYRSVVGNGLHFKAPFIDQVIKINVTEQMVDAESQEVITKDNLNAKVDAQVYFKVKSTEDAVKKCLYNVDDYEVQIVSLARTTLRDIIGKMSFKDVNSNREQLNKKLEKELDLQTDSWGIQIVRTELKEIEPPQDVQETMNKVLKAENEKTAAIDYATAEETRADGLRRAKIKEAEGSKRGKILVAEGEATAIKLVNEAAEKYFVGNAVELKKLETARDALAENTKIITTNKSSIGDIISYVAGIDASREKNDKSKK
jgi:regulator of protease activity HflC (stomatin/prohibitin superfamily)